MIRAVWFAIALCFAKIAIAVESTPVVFYPLPTLAQGKVFAAKKLFLADTGGVWLQDVRNQILFFDGQNIMPQSGSALEHDTEQVAFLDNAFWSFFQNEIYRTVPKQGRELVFSLKPGTEINRIGTSRRYVWVADDSNFYTFHIDTGEFNTYSLHELYKFSQSSSIQINDAQFVLSKWSLATNAGVYLSNEASFDHVASSGKNYVEKIYYSDKRREIVIGSLKGVLIFDLSNPRKPIKRIPGSHVLSIAETNNEYWIGTEKGLLVYSFLTGNTKRLLPSDPKNNAIVSGKIYALLNDQAGGIWIATDRGVRYFSLFSHKFARHPKQLQSPYLSAEKPRALKAMNNGQGYWVISDSGVYAVTLGKSPKREQFYRGKVYDLVEKENVLWLATDKGIRQIDVVSGKPLSGKQVPDLLRNTEIRFINIDHEDTLWWVSDNRLWSYQLNERKLSSFGSEWMIEKYLPGQMTNMIVTSTQDLVLGTEHGVYVLRNGKIRFAGESAPYGYVISVEPVSEHEVWVAARYGVYKLNLETNYVEPLPLLDDHITPRCLISNRDGIWLTSSSGLTHYSNQGEILKHYGEPYGLVSNEFSSQLCTSSGDNERVILLGSHLNLITVNTQELLVSKVPDVKVIISQVMVNQRLLSLGTPSVATPVLTYGESIAFKFGALPQVNKLNLEYRLNNDEWALLDSSTLSIEHLIPGEYHLEVRAVINESQRGQSNFYQFEVAKPWFLTAYAIVGYVLSAIWLVVILVYWRSRMMSKANRKLKSQVALKTNQLRHQSRILLSNNQQLRKQLQIRRLILSQSINAMKERFSQHGINPNSDFSVAERKLLKSFRQELDLLLHVRNTNSESLAVYNLTLILQSVLDGWENELAKAGVSVELKSDDDCDYFVSLGTSNLDELLNLLFDSLVRRCYRNQAVAISTRKEGETIVLTLVDEGESIESDNNSATIQAVQTMVEQSGGKFNLHMSTERNLTELCWRVSEPLVEDAIEHLDVMDTDEHTSMDDPWLIRIRQLVDEQYADPDFSTSTAAKLLYVSERSLQRRLKSTVEKTFTEYLTEVRLDNACRRLLAGEKVAEVAFECGFNDPSYFSQRFKHRFGMSPTQFIEQQDS
ncbi:helix-turn-helix domain-containing protein [Vibrio japonicus]|uniref:Helix-turn-helix domain-containing protein n=1 Tax=Vibrio japonicus TaxID=1824638 RepID=A0ABY5LFU3_9VIBR|nr:helix-turn-helix domain-containing protein [Vibrio japonicus]UUM29811.1 helix-turn-helix domain-containing protein [Vibrio japonicus]